MTCISLPTALLIGGGLSAAGGVASGVLGANAAHQAAKTESAAADKAIASTENLYGQTKDLLNPFVQAGQSAIGTTKDLLGLGTLGQAGINSALEATPGYQFTKQQGLQAAQSGFASQGLAESGPAIKGAVQYAENLAGTTYEQRLQDYFTQVGQGSQAAASLAGFTTDTARGLNQLYTGQGQSLAGGIVGGTNALTGGINSATSGISNAALTLGLANAGMFGAQPQAKTGVGNSLYYQQSGPSVNYS